MKISLIKNMVTLTAENAEECATLVRLTEKPTLPSKKYTYKKKQPCAYCGKKFERVKAHITRSHKLSTLTPMTNHA